jgi:hypothetical protein
MRVNAYTICLPPLRQTSHLTEFWHYYPQERIPQPS